MLMKWSDLEPGDKVKWRKKAIKFFEKRGINSLDYYNYYLNKILTVTRVVQRSKMEIDVSYMREGLEKSVTIQLNGINSTFGDVLLEVVEIRED